jgi:hypothetical protein
MRNKSHIVRYGTHQAAERVADFDRDLCRTIDALKPNTTFRGFGAWEIVGLRRRIESKKLRANELDVEGVDERHGVTLVRIFSFPQIHELRTVEVVTNYYIDDLRFAELGSADGAA